MGRDDEIHDLRQEYASSPAATVFHRIAVYEVGYNVFIANCDEWQRTIDDRMPRDLNATIDMQQNTGWVQPYKLEIARTLHNVVSSAFMLVDTSRVLYRALYQDANLIPDYQTEVHKRFIDSEVAWFIKDLRNYCLHYRLPIAITHLGLTLGPQSGEIIWRVPVTIAQLMIYSGWNAPSKKFIARFSNDIDLEAVVAEYRAKVVDFNDWFRDRRNEVHRADIEYRDSIARRIEALRNG